jgi:PIN domain nuclease of toxin-antitoxin system
VTVLLDTHVAHWWSAEPERVSPAAVEAIVAAGELAIAAASWFELTWLARRGRIVVAIPIRSWLAELAGGLRTVGVNPAVAHIAASLPLAFPGDTADRLIFATAIEYGWPLVTKDPKLRGYRHPSPLTIW